MEQPGTRERDTVGRQTRRAPGPGAGAPLPAGYRVLGELGRGARTTVYRIGRGDEEFAFKLDDAVAPDPDAALVALRREAALVAAVDHPGAPRIFEVGTVAGRPYQVMDVVHGRPLGDRLAAGPLTPAEATRCATEVALALAAVHRVGLVHRDLKPQNLMLVDGGSTQLIDYGLAARAEDPAEDSAEDPAAGAGTTVGSLAYAPPEQSGMLARPVDARSDLYSLGVVLFECLTGSLPFLAPELGELLRKHAVEPAPDVRSLDPQLPEGLAAVVDRLLAKDPDDRYQRAEDVARDLSVVAVEHGWNHVPQPAAGGDLGAPAGRAAEVAELSERRRESRSGVPGAALIRGASGAGKSRLAHHVASLAEADGSVVLHGKASPDDALPLTPLRQAVEGWLDGLAGRTEAERENTRRRLRVAAGSGGPLLAALSPRLSELLGVAPVTGAGEADGPFATAVADFLLSWAEAAGGLVLHLDDLQWLDPASGRVLERLAASRAAAPLLVLGTVRDDADSAAAAAPLLEHLDGFVDLDLTLGPLEETGVAALVRGAMPGLGDVEGLAEVLSVRSGGNPFVAHEVLRAVVDGGVLSPRWGRWELDRDRLDALDLPEDAIDLVLARVERIGEQARSVLLAAAVIGTRFPVPLLAEVLGQPEAQVQALVAEAVAVRLVEPAPDGGHRFVHDRIREALFGGSNGGSDGEGLRELHLRVAAVLEARPDRYAAPAVFALAEHHMAAAPPRTENERAGAQAAAHAAGVAALEDQAAEQALRLLEFAASLSPAEELAPVLMADLGVAHQRNRRFAEAAEWLQAAVEREPDPLRRAEMRAALARTHTSNWRTGLALQATDDGLRDLGFRVPRTLAGAALKLLVTLPWSILLAATGLGRLRPGRPKYERLRRAAELRSIAAYTSVIDLNPIRMVLEALAAVPLVNRLERGAEYARAYAGVGQISRVVGLDRLGTWLYRRAMVIGRELGDPRLVAFIDVVHHAAGYIGPGADLVPWARSYEQHGRWLDTGLVADVVGATANEEILRGRTSVARAWAARARDPHRPPERDSAMFLPEAVLIATGRFADAAAGVAVLEDLIGSERSRGLQMMSLLTRAHTTVEQQETGAPLDELVADVAAMKARPADAIRPHRPLYLLIAKAQLTRLRRSGPNQRVAQAKIAADAVATFAKLADSPLFRAHLRLAQAELLELEGRAAEALAKLDTVGVPEPDAPLIAFQVALQRARSQAALGHDGQARRDAMAAIAVAEEQDWPHRARWVVEEFPALGSVVRASSTRVSSVGPAPGERHRLQALLDISRAASRELDPLRFATIALDQTIRSLRAERAFLFVAADSDAGPGSEDGALVPFVGRDAAGNFIDTPTAYATSLVERVRTTREHVLVTGTDQGAALGSESVVLHGLRSILVAPVVLEERLLGVVYLDSQVAKGIFTDQDTSVLTAIAAHLAAALETARAAQLKVEVESARRRQQLAELLGESLRDLSATLDPDEVLLRLLRAAGRALPEAEAVLVLPGKHAQVLRLVDGESVRSAPSEELAGAAEVAEALVVPDPGGSRLVAPLRSGLGEAPAAGALVLRAASFDQADLEVASTLAAQAVAALANATLHAQVQQLAVIDELTGIANRRRLFDQAGRELASARRRAEPLLAVMIDIDHFKRVNDSFGHATGDDVIREVAARLRDAVRGTDLLGRYGGEEFGLVLTDPDEAAAAGRRLLQAVSLGPVETRSGPLAVTVSVGVALLGEADTDVEALFARADAALYEAKQTGRNRVVVATPTPP